LQTIIASKEKPMTRKTAGLVLITFGITLLIVSLLVDPLGFGCKPGIGWKQWTGVGISILILVAGIVLRLLKPTSQNK